QPIRSRLASPSVSRPVSSLGLEERENEAENGQRLDDREAEDHLALQDAAGLGLAGDGLHAHAEDEADADAGADGGETVTDGREATGDFHCFSSLTQTRRRALCRRTDVDYRTGVVKRAHRASAHPPWPHRGKWRTVGRTHRPGRP